MTRYKPTMEEKMVDKPPHANYNIDSERVNTKYFVFLTIYASFLTRIRKSHY